MPRPAAYVLRRLCLVGALGVATPALAQGGSGIPVLPDIGNVTVRTPTGPAAPVMTVGPPGQGGAELDISLRDTRTVIDWRGSGFNIGPRDAVTFRDGRTRADGGSIAVLNRDLSGRPSLLRGLLGSDANVSVWLMNTRGVLVGPGATIRTGGFVATARAMDEADFLQAPDAGSVVNGDGAVRPGVQHVAASGAGGIIVTPAGTSFSTGTVSRLVAQDAGAPVEDDGPREDEVFIGAIDAAPAPVGVVVQSMAGSPVLVVMADDPATDDASQGAFAGRNPILSAALLGSTGERGAARFAPITATRATATSRGVILTADQ
ncbi:filamentous hemagglutinin N-terminal domain-containing protein [Sphingomonas sp. HF-S3]|uniref:Filamentous hemagglutinin N-terminal domain-containing protein n=1 Tax=Sphingomonas rustica TaxID=3103142 RepID=A0ABV0BDF3_9SPHN